MTIHNKMYMVLMQYSTIINTINILYLFIGINIVPFHFSLRDIHPYLYVW